MILGAVLTPLVAITSMGLIPTGYDRNGHKDSGQAQELYKPEHPWFPKEMMSPHISPEYAELSRNPTPENAKKAVAMKWFRAARGYRAKQLIEKETTEAIYEVAEAFKAANPDKQMKYEDLIIGMATRYKSFYAADLDIILPSRADVVGEEKKRIAAEIEEAAKIATGLQSRGGSRKPGDMIQ